MKCLRVIVVYIFLIMPTGNLRCAESFFPFKNFFNLINSEADFENNHTTNHSGCTALHQAVKPILGEESFKEVYFGGTYEEDMRKAGAAAILIVYNYDVHASQGKRSPFNYARDQKKEHPHIYEVLTAGAVIQNIRIKKERLSLVPVFVAYRDFIKDQKLEEGKQFIRNYVESLDNNLLKENQIDAIKTVLFWAVGLENELISLKN